MTDDDKNDGHILMADTLLIAAALNDAQHSANRYAETEYEHRRKEALEHLTEVRDMIDVTLDRYNGPPTDQEATDE